MSASSDETTCAECSKGSEFSWNPDNNFVTARLNRFYTLGDLLESAYRANDFAKVKELAKENLELAEVYRCNWNYGNAIHDTNRFLGLISLKGGEIDTATDYLRKAGKTTGSPTLNTFGPDLDLANELLRRGKVEAVSAYLTDIKSFWKMDNGQVDAWLSEIGKGSKPELDRLAANRPGPFLMFLFSLIIVWPPILSAAFLYAKRARIKKRVLYFAITTLLGYMLMFMVNWICFLAIDSIVTRIDPTVILVLGFGMVMLLPLIASYYLTRFFYAPVADSAS